MDSRIGKRGEDGYRPRQTISHQPVVSGLTTRDIGNGYYVVIDHFPAVDVNQTIEELQATLETEPEGMTDAEQTKSRRRVTRDTERAGDALPDALHDDTT